jgi:transcriptional regulator with XRE-family HTH domain
MSGHITLDASQVESIRIKILRLMERNKMTQSQIAMRVGCSPSTVCHFLTGPSGSTGLAIKLARAYPEIAVHLNCPACGHCLQ